MLYIDDLVATLTIFLLILGVKVEHFDRAPFKTRDIKSPVILHDIKFDYTNSLGYDQKKSLLLAGIIFREKSRAISKVVPKVKS